MMNPVRITLGAATLGFVALVGCDSSGTSSTAGSSSSAEAPTTAKPTTTAAQSTTVAATTTTEAPSLAIPAGQYAVSPTPGAGLITPGVYRVAGYYARKDANDEIIQNDLPGDGFTLMQVAPTDVTVELDGPALHIEDSKPIDPIAAGYTGGTYLVGMDLAPGRYNVAATDRAAYAARLDAKGGIIDNDLNQGNVLITIKPTDWAFSYNGTLTKVG
jgi:hypothetical protein